MRLNDKVAIITGGSSGIGLAAARRLGAEGARIVIASQNKERIEAAAERVRKEDGVDVLGLECDVSSESQVIATVAQTLERFGQLDILVNNAGMMLFKKLEEYTAEDWQRVLGVDLMGSVHFTKQAFLHMTSGGAIVNVASVHAVMTSPLVAPYAAAKAATLSLTRSASIEGRDKGIRANVILPGAIDTGML